jgi:hypothetical protein
MAALAILIRHCARRSRTAEKNHTKAGAPVVTGSLMIIMREPQIGRSGMDHGTDQQMLTCGYLATGDRIYRG